MERSFLGIVASVLAAPLATGIACSAKDVSEGSADATVPLVGEHDGGGPTDATISTSSISDACAPTPFDDVSPEDTLDGCVAYGRLPCGLPPTAQVTACVLDPHSCIEMCEDMDVSLVLGCQLAPASCEDGGSPLDAEVLFECIGGCAIAGRRPLGLVAPRTIQGSPVGDYFGSMAHLEAASVRAFRDLERWLLAFGAPRRLSRAAHRFAEDERRHARAATRLARRFGGAIAGVRVGGVAQPTLALLLEDNAVEGCVKETFGALVATWQSEQAGDPRIRRTMRRVAADETRHAALAWEVLDWGMARLSLPHRRRVGRALNRALRALTSGHCAPVHPALCRVVGHPSREQELRLARELARMIRREHARA